MSRWLRWSAAFVFAASVGLPSAASAAPAAEPLPPKLVEGAEVSYPDDLATSEEGAPSGVVVVRFVVGVDGSTTEIEVVEGLHPRLDELAKEAVASLRYEPARYEGQAVEMVLQLGIEFVAPAPPQDPAPDAQPDLEAEDEDAGITMPPGPVGELRGVVRRAGDRVALEEIQVFVTPADPRLPLGRVRLQIPVPAEPAWSLSLPTDGEGRFGVEALPAGRVRLVIVHAGYERVDQVEEVPEQGTLELQVSLRRRDDNPFRTVVETQRDDAVTSRSISAEEITNLPGTQGDALKSITNFPGVARAPFGAGLLVIRGSAPSDSRVYLAGHEIPQLFHFGALSSVFNSDIIATLDFIPGNFDSRYGSAIGGIVDVQPRAGRRDGYHGYVDADIYDAGLLLEGPVGKGSFVVGARRSYIDAILPAVIPDDVNLDFEAAPRYYDYQGLFDYPVGAGNLSVRSFGSDDRLVLLTGADNDDDQEEFGTTIYFHRVDLDYRVKHGPFSFMITPSYRHDHFSGAGSDVFEFETTTNTFSFRSELEHRLGPRVRYLVGTELTTGRWAIDAVAPTFPTPGEGGRGDEVSGELGGAFADPAIYFTTTFQAGKRLRLHPGARLTYNAVLLQDMAVEPRFRFDFGIADNTTLVGGVGMYSQPADIFEFNEVWGNPNIELERAVHTSLGVKHVFADIGASVEVTGFWRHIYDLAVFSTAVVPNEGGGFRPERFRNDGRGEVAGVEVLLRKELTKRFYGWLTYTYSRALYDLRDGEGLVPFDFDQPHVLTLLGVVKLPRGWQVGARFRLVSGNPVTPIRAGIVDASDGDYVAVEGSRNSDRLPLFHQLDLRVDKTWTLRRSAFSAYLDIQNAYNRRNVEGRSYAYDFSDYRDTAGLPIIPSLGLKVAF